MNLVPEKYRRKKSHDVTSGTVSLFDTVLWEDWIWKIACWKHSKFFFELVFQILRQLQNSCLAFLTHLGKICVSEAL